MQSASCNTSMVTCKLEMTVTLFLYRPFKNLNPCAVEYILANACLLEDILLHIYIKTTSATDVYITGITILPSGHLAICCASKRLLSGIDSRMYNCMIDILL